MAGDARRRLADTGLGTTGAVKKPFKSSVGQSFDPTTIHDGLGEEELRECNKGPKIFKEDKNGNHIPYIGKWEI